MAKWSKEQDSLVRLMEEDKEFRFSPENMPARLLLARFINFSRDKAQRPEMFCWPGAWMAGERVSEQAQDIFTRHQALFSDKADDGGIFPVVLLGKDPVILHDTFEKFYGWNVTYDLARQWIAGDGDFSYDYRWLSQKHSSEEMKQWAVELFDHAYGISPVEFQIL